jgi:acyl-CoA reductase-like NAD-dependent aldehyde dehydrogenase
MTPRTITVTSPLDGTEVGSVVITEPEDVEAAVAGSREAFAEWGSLSHAERRPYLRAYTKAVLANMDRIADVLVAETGKHRTDAHAETTAALTAMDMYSRLAARLLRPKRGRAWPFPMIRGWTEYHPLGVAGVISPWNYPFYLTMLSTIQALAAGCTVIAKPSEVTPHSGQLVEDLAREAGLPHGVVTVIHGHGDTGAALVRSTVDIIAFTGSSETGKKIGAEAAETMKPVILELGGKDAMIVLEDANLKTAAKAAVTFGVINAGQTCVGVERVYVVDEVYDEFLAEVDRAMSGLSVATGDKGDIGPLIAPEQIKTIEDHISDALGKGAAVRRGGNRVDTDHGVYYEPTLVVDVDHSMDLMQDETFGPVVPIMRVADEAEALHRANDSRYGLHGSVWTKNKRRGEWVASRMRTGTVAINDHLVNFFYPSITLGGVGDSGISGLMGDEGIKAFCIHKSITSGRLGTTSQLMGLSLPRRIGPGYWKALAKALFGWRR